MTSSYICPLHFPKHDIVRCDNRFILKPGVVPTIFNDPITSDTATGSSECDDENEETFEYMDVEYESDEAETKCNEPEKS